MAKKKQEPDPTAPMTIRCVVACANANGEPDFFPVEVETCRGYYEDGEHITTVLQHACDNRYEQPMLVFDEPGGPAWLFAQFKEWSKCRDA